MSRQPIGGFMLYWAAVFLVIAIVAGLLGMSGVGGLSMNIAWILVVVFVILFVISLIFNGRKGLPKV